MKVHVVSETEFVMKGQGVHTAFVDAVELLREKRDIQVVVNNEGRGDVFHSHTYGPYYFWQGRGYRGRRVFTAHVIPDSIKGSLPYWRLWMPAVKWFLKKVYSYADVVVAISPMVEQAIRDTGAKTRIVNIGNPVPLARWKRTEENRRRGRALLGVSEDEFVVLGVGQVQHRKGVKTFFDVAEKTPEAKFVWAGGRPFGLLTDGVGELDHKIATAPANVHFAGMFELEDMPAVYAAADMLLFPSTQENCPLAPLEAAACGMPVIYRALPEYEQLYHYPYLKAADSAEFAELTKRLMQDMEFYAEGLKISEKLVGQFERNAIRAALVNLYSDLNSEALRKKQSEWGRNIRRRNYPIPQWQLAD